MASAQSGTYSESGITISLPTTKTSGEKHAFYRQIALSTLKLESESSKSSHLYCFDAIAGTGLSGLQWKKHLADKVTVTCADNRRDGCIQTQCDLNHVKTENWNLLDCSQRNRTPAQGQDQIYISSLPTQVLLYSEAFDFVYLQTHGKDGLHKYIDSLISTIKVGGVACLLCPNIASQCFRSPKQIQRQYYAYTRKTIYVTEMAARIIIGDIVRIAGRHGRVADVLCTLSGDDHLMFIVRIKMSSQMAEEAAAKCRPVLHCLMCAERVVYPMTHCPIEMPYSLLPCECNSQNPGKTATILGPMWVGKMYDIPFLEKLTERMKTDFPKSTGNVLLNTVITEAICDNNVNSSKSLTNTIKSSMNTTSDEPALKRQKIENQSENNDNQSENLDTQSGKLDSEPEKFENQSENLSEVPQVKDDVIESSKCPEQNNVPDSLKPDTTATVEGAVCQKHEEMPIFYYHLHQQKFKVVPRSEVVVTRLKQAGYRASRTHFEPYSIRTNATLKQLQVIIEEINK